MTDSSTPRFSLLDEPWIPVRYLDGRSVEVSIRTAFHDALPIREVGGELPTQTFAITRLLLAILYAATADTGGWTAEGWRRMWAEGLPLTDIDEYLDEAADRFWLLHPERPFFQVAHLASTSGEIKDTAPLIMDLPSNKRLFTTRSGEASLRLPFSEAARWLINAQAFDVSGIKSGAVGDARVKGGRGYPIGVAWSGHLGGIILEGGNLHETLLLNFVGGGVAELTLDHDNDSAPWEETESDTASERDGLLPTGPIRLFTWQSRRIRLVADGDAIVGCVLANGDALTPQNRFIHESMTAWRYSEPQTKKLGQPTYMPREHQPGRAFWRGISALLSKDAAQPTSLRPATIEALHEHLGSGAIPATFRIGARAIGVAYGSQSSVVDDIIDDRLNMAVALLAGERPDLAAEAENAVSLADSGVRKLKDLAANLARAAGGSPDDADAARNTADRAAYAELDAKYRRWLAAIDSDSEPLVVISAWKSTAFTSIRSLGADLVRNAGPAAWVGREVRTARGAELLTTPRAEAWFLRDLRAIFGSPQQINPDSGRSDDRVEADA